MRLRRKRDPSATPSARERDILDRRPPFTGIDEMQILLCVEAWVDLTADRQLGWVVGGIPFTAFIDWARFRKLDRDAAQLTWQVIRYLDSDRMEREDSERRAKNPTTGRR